MLLISLSRTSSVSRRRSAPASTSWSLSSPRTDSHSDHIVRIVSVMNRQSSSLSGGGWLGLRIFGAELTASFGAAFAEATRQDVNTRAETMSEEAHEVAYNGVTYLAESPRRTRAARAAAPAAVGPPLPAGTTPRGSKSRPPAPPQTPASRTLWTGRLRGCRHGPWQVRPPAARQCWRPSPASPASSSPARLLFLCATRGRCRCRRRDGRGRCWMAASGAGCRGASGRRRRLCFPASSPCEPAPNASV